MLLLDEFENEQNRTKEARVISKETDLESVWQGVEGSAGIRVGDEETQELFSAGVLRPENSF